MISFNEPKYRSNFWLITSMLLAIYYLVRGFIAARYGAEDWKIALCACGCALSLWLAYRELRKPQPK